MDAFRKLPTEKREVVLKFVESMQNAEAADKSDLKLSQEEQLLHWNDWVQNGVQGPIEEDTPPEFP
jgi:hypothetical protein